MSKRSSIRNDNDETAGRSFKECSTETPARVGKEWIRSEKARFFLGNAHRILAWPLFCLVLSILVWTAINSELKREKVLLETDAMENVALLSESYAEYLNSSIERIDQLMMLVQYDWDVSKHAYRLENVARKGVFNFEHSAAITIVDRDGRPLTSSYPFDVNLSWTDSKAFKVHRVDPSAQLRIETPVQGKISGRTIMRVTRRLNDRNGNFDGMLVVSVDPDYFCSFGNVPNLGEGNFQVLVGPGGEAQGADANGLEEKCGNQILRVIPTGSAPALLSGFEWFPDSKPRYVASYPVADYPFFAIVGISEEAALAHYRLSRVAYRNAGILIDCVLLLFAVLSTFMSTRLALKTQRLDAVRNAYRTATECGDEGYYMWSAIRDKRMRLVDFRIVDCNERGAELFGTTRDKLLNERVSSVAVLRSYWPALMKQCSLAMDGGFYTDDFEVPGGDESQARWLQKRMIRSEGGLAVTLRDISSQKAHETELTRLATRDTLTNLPNRHWMMSFLPKALEEAATAQDGLAILFLDLDDFKNVNDTLGHTAGDLLLRQVASRLQSVLRPGDSVVRLGGDEFTFVLGSLDRKFDVSAIAAGILRLFETPFGIHHRSIRIDASIGISVFPQDGGDAETLVKNADIAMYAAKAEGKGKFRFYDQDLYLQMERRLSNEQELLRAIQEDHFVMHYQPRVDARSGEMLGMEALVRWQHPEKGMIPPDDFIPLAESSRMILPLGKLVMEKVFAQLASWKLAGFPVVPVSINVSAHQFVEDRPSAFIKTCMDRYGIAAALVEIELTESAMMGDFGQVYEEMQAINALGIQMHIDDFGTGYSSLSLLHRLNVSVLKVDRAFTTRLSDDKPGKVFYSAIVSLAKALQMRVVAEGVETRDQLRVLQELGCDEIQGYLISRPLPPEAIPALLQKRVLFDSALLEG